MKKSRFTETQIVSILKQADAGVPVKDLCRQAGVSTATYYQWKSKYGGMEASDLKRVRELEVENAKLKRMYAELVLDNAAMKDLIAKNYRTGAEARGGALPDAGARAAAAPVLHVRGVNDNLNLTQARLLISNSKLTHPRAVVGLLCAHPASTSFLSM